MGLMAGFESSRGPPKTSAAFAMPRRLRHKRVINVPMWMGIEVGLLDMRACIYLIKTRFFLGLTGALAGAATRSLLVIGYDSIRRDCRDPMEAFLSAISAQAWQKTRERL